MWVALRRDRARLRTARRQSKYTCHSERSVFDLSSFRLPSLRSNTNVTANLSGVYTDIDLRYTQTDLTITS
jgi:hypothetical protein